MCRLKSKDVHVYFSRSKEGRTRTGEGKPSGPELETADKKAGGLHRQPPITASSVAYRLSRSWFT